MVASGLRAGTGSRARSIGPRPETLLELYEFEACPYCRKVREAITELDLDVLVKPCPKGGNRYRPEVKERGGQAMFPWLVDPNTGTSMYESADIIRYLYRHYGRGQAAAALRMGPLGDIWSTATSVICPAGLRQQPSILPPQPLELYSFENCPYCRVVRATLCELEVPWILRTVGKGSASRAAFAERSGRMQVPWLVDPNTNIEMFESRDICRYLNETYGATAS